MAGNYANLRTYLDSQVYANSNNEVTAQMVRAALESMVDSLGTGYQFMGVATTTNPGTAQTPDYKCFYIATEVGTYTYLGGLTISDGDGMCILYWDTAWHKKAAGVATTAQVAELGQEVVGNEIYHKDDIYITAATGKTQLITYNFKKGKTYKFNVEGNGVISAWSLRAADGSWIVLLVSNTNVNGENVYFQPLTDLTNIYFSVDSSAALQTDSISVSVTEVSEFLSSNLDLLYSKFGKKYIETQTAAAANLFKDVFNKKKGYIRIYSSSTLYVAKILQRPSTFLTEIDETFKYIDLSSASGISIYVESPANSTISVEFIEEGILQNVLFSQYKGIRDTLDIDFRGYKSMIPITVKKDGSGDFTTIQEAINSITDASIVKQYDIQVYDDFEITDLTNLWMLDYPNTHVSASPAVQCALVITKDYVNIRGIGRKKKLSIKSPSDLPATSFPVIQVIIPQGNCIIKNFDVILEGGRYAIHQENFGPMNGINANATTIYEDLNVIHKGNAHYPNGSGWTASLAQANGTASGCRWIFRNCKWTAKEQGTPIYMHLNKGFTEKSKIEFYHCSFLSYVPMTLAQAARQSYIYDIGSDMGADIILDGNNFTGFDAFSFADIYGNEQSRTTDNISDGEINYVGNGNTKMIVNQRENPSLSFETIENNVTIDVVGGSAYDELWGETYKTFGGSAPESLSKGMCVGSRKIFDQPDINKTSIYSLAYRLGNCALVPKTLVVNVGGTDYTLTFNQNYMTSDGSSYSYNTTPRYTNAEIIAQINEMYPAVFTAKIGGWIELQTPTDCKKECRVFQNYNIEVGTIVGIFRTPSFGSFNAVVPYDNVYPKSILLGVICESTNKREGCSVAIADKSYYPMQLLYPNGADRGTLFKVSGGKLVITEDESEASFYAIDEATISILPNVKVES